MPRPVLQAMVLADHVYQDRFTGKYVIAGTFANVSFGNVVAQATTPPAESRDAGEQWLAVRGPMGVAGSPYLYFALTEVHGEVPLVVKFVDLSDSSLLFEGQFAVASLDPVAVAEYALPMPPLPIAKSGAFSLDLLWEGEILGSWRVTATRADGLSEGDSP